MTGELPKYDDLMFPTLVAIDELGGSASIDEIQERLIGILGFTEEQMSVTYPTSGAAILPDRMSWARSFLRLAGLLENPRTGVWVLTEEGRSAWPVGETHVRERVKAAYKEYLKERKAKAAEEAAAVEAQGGPQSETGDWSERLLVKLQSIEPSAFERLAQRLLRESGFTRVEVTGKSGDGGIDGTRRPSRQSDILSGPLSVQALQRFSCCRSGTRLSGRNAGPSRQGSDHHNGDFHSGRTKGSHT